MHIGKRIRKVRLANNIEPKKAAAGIFTPEELYKVEEGNLQPTPNVLSTLAERLDVPAEYFIDHQTKDEQLEVRLTDARLFLDGMKERSTERVIKAIAERYPYICSLEQEVHYLLLKTNYYILVIEISDAIHTFDNELCPLIDHEEQLPEHLQKLFYNVKGKVYFYKRRYTVSNESYLKGAKISGSSLQTAKAYFNSALSLYKMHRISEAMNYCWQAIFMSTELNDTCLLSKAYLLLGILYYDCKNYEKAMKYYREALEIGEQYQYSEIRANSKHNIGDIYKELGDYDNALKYLKQSLNARKKVDPAMIINTFYSILEIYYIQKENQQMQSLINEAESYIKDDKDFYELQIMKAKLELLQGNPDAYEKMMDESISYLYEQKMWKILFYLKVTDEMISYYASNNDKQQKFLQIQEETNRQLSKEARMSV